MTGRPISEKTLNGAKIVLQMLTRAAEHGRTCPSNQDIGEMLDRGISGASKAISDLETAGLIAVQRGHMSRVVTIVATGKKTAGTITHQHWRERGVRPFKPPPGARPAQLAPPRRVLPVVHRDPCSRCGTRADIGCQHTRRAEAIA